MKKTFFLTIINSIKTGLGKKKIKKNHFFKTKNNPITYMNLE